MTQSPTPGSAYLERPIPSALVLSTFALGVVPLAAFQLWPNFWGPVPALTLFVAAGLGTSHFFLTLAVYLRADHRRHFTSSPLRVGIYVIAPLAILGLVAWIEGSMHLSLECLLCLGSWTGGSPRRTWTVNNVCPRS